MSRPTRLLKLMDQLRSRHRPVTAATLAQRLGVSERTVYRDIVTLVEAGADIEGSAGVGYLLRSGFFLPPLMFSDDEIEALVLGMRWVQGQADQGLSGAADTALAKIAGASPRDLREKIAESGLWAPRARTAAAPGPDIGEIRRAIRMQRKLRLGYRDAQSAESGRLIWPIALGYFEGGRVIAAWCELRQDFRHFRVDRITALETLPERYPGSRRMLVDAWKATHRPR